MREAFSKRIDDVQTRVAKEILFCSEIIMNVISQRNLTGLAPLVLSFFITACGAHSTSPSTETFTVYEDATKVSLLDLGAAGNSLGDVYHFSAPLHSERGGPVTGELIGSKTLVKMPSDANPKQERRATLMFFTFGDGKDQIIAFGAADYSPTVPEFQAGQSAVRPVLGGTGKYIGARGQVTSKRNQDGPNTQVFALLR